MTAEEKKALIKKRILPTALVSFAVPLVICFAVPFEIYCTNRAEFLFSAGAFLPVLVLYTLLFAAGLFFALLFLPPRAYTVSRNIWIMFAVLFVLQGVYLNRGIVAFSTSTSGKDNVWLIVGNSVLWILCLGGAVALAWLPDKKELIPTVSMILAVVVIAIQLVGFVNTSVRHKDVYAPQSKQIEQDADAPKRILTGEGLTRLSRNKNILYFVFDQFDQFFAESTQKYAPDVYEKMNGYVGYNDCISLYGHTYPSIAYMITRNDHDADKTRLEYLNSTYRDDKTLSVLAQNDWETSVYTEQYYSYTVDAGLPDYIANASEVKSVKVRNPFAIGIHLVHMALYRCAPAALKVPLGIINANQCNRNVVYKGVNGQNEYQAGTSRARKRVAGQPFTLTDKNVFKFIHMSGFHKVMASLETRTMNKKTKTVKEGVKILRQCMAVVDMYAQFLKENGLYENTTILITGDHPSPYYNMGSIDAPKLTALYVKRAGDASAPFTLSNAPVSHEDLWPTVMDEAGIAMPADYGTSLFDVAENDERERRFIWHTYRHRNSMDVYTYTIKGSGRDFSHWEKHRGKHYDRGIMS